MAAATPKAPAPQLYVLAEEGCEAPVAPPRVNRLPPEGGHESLLAAAGVKGVEGGTEARDGGSATLLAGRLRRPTRPSSSSGVVLGSTAWSASRATERSRSVELMRSLRAARSAPTFVYRPSFV